jgi:hypothetical protein
VIDLEAGWKWPQLFEFRAAGTYRLLLERLIAKKAALLTEHTNSRFVGNSRLTGNPHLTGCLVNNPPPPPDRFGPEVAWLDCYARQTQSLRISNEH